MDLQITERAAEKIRQSAAAENVKLGAAWLRLAVVPGGCSGLTYDLGWDTTVGETDQTGTIGDIPVVLDMKSLLYLEGSTLDFSDGLEGKGFHFDNPQAARECACGESFGL